MYSKVLSATLCGVDGRLITVEADVGDGLPIFNMVGFLASEVRESSDRVRTALKNSGFQISPKRITVNLSPADVRKEGSYFDLPISIALLISYGFIPEETVKDSIFVGELSLNGEVRPLKGILSIVDYAKKLKLKDIYIPFDNRKEASCISGINIYAVKSLKDVVEHLIETKLLTPIIHNEWKINESPIFKFDFSEVKGQKMLKRATEIAVSGMHNILYLGPPGSGKSMIAKRIPSIMPNLTYNESIELTKIYSVKGLLNLDEGMILKRPFRMPHHSITATALIGGGKEPKPGEISLAHHGVLFLDEFLEFQKDVIEMLRQPLEDRNIIISRLKGSYKFLSDFMLVAAMNPCPCGYYPDLTRCHCTHYQIQRYLNKVSQALLDRIDLSISVKKLEYDELYNDTKEEESKKIKERVIKVQDVQKQRLNKYGLKYNSQIPSNLLDDICKLGKKERLMRKEAFQMYGLSGRSSSKILRVARTIADMNSSECVLCEHLSEALAYRMVNFYRGGDKV